MFSFCRILTFLWNQDPIPVRVVHPLPRQRERNLNGWGQESVENLGSALWHAILLVVVSGQWVVCSFRCPKSLYHPYQELLHTCHPLAGLSHFVAAGSGEFQAQTG